MPPTPSVPAGRAMRDVGEMDDVGEMHDPREMRDPLDMRHGRSAPVVRASSWVSASCASLFS